MGLTREAGLTRETGRPATLLDGAPIDVALDGFGVLLFDGTRDPFARIRHGVPCWGWRAVPARLGLATRRQLRAAGLRPGGQEPAGRIECRRGRRFAWLYRRDLAAPVRPMTPARRVALARAMAARAWCPTCQTYAPGPIPTRYGECLDCIDGIDVDDIEPEEDFR